MPWIAGITSEEGCFRSSCMFLIALNYLLINLTFPFHSSVLYICYIFCEKNCTVILPYEDKLSELNENWSKVAPKSFLLYGDGLKLAEKVKAFYFGDKSKRTKESVNGIKGNTPQRSQQIGWDDLESLTNAYSDRYFHGCVREAASLHAKHAPVHLYYYTYKPDIGYGYIQESVRGQLPAEMEIILGFAKFWLYRNVLNWEINDYGKQTYARLYTQYFKSTFSTFKIYVKTSYTICACNFFFEKKN